MDAELNEADRRMNWCDECGPTVKGRMYTALPSGLDLRYCLHHANKHRPRLEELGAVMYELSA